MNQLKLNLSKKFFKTVHKEHKMKLLLSIFTLLFSMQSMAVEIKSLIKVDDMDINELHFKIFAQQLAKNKKNINKDALNAIGNVLIKTQLLAASAEKQKLDESPVVKAALEIARMRVLNDIAIAAYLGKHPLKEEQLKKLYKQQFDKTSKTEYNASHILIDGEKKAKGIIRFLGKGKDFAKLAKEHSTDPSSEKGGKLGWFGKEAVLPIFAETVSQLKKGEYTKSPIKSDFGWHIIKLNDLRELKAPPYEKVKHQLAAIIQRNLINAHVKELRKKAKIKITEPPKGKK